MDFYDEAGALLGMDLDDEIVTFQYGNREYRIELWKGNYGFGNALAGNLEFIIEIYRMLWQIHMQKIVNKVDIRCIIA